MNDIFHTAISKKTVTIMLCSGCNTDCSHCYISYKGNRDVEQAKQMIINLLSQGYQVVLNGTEPLLFDGYLQLFKIAGQQQIFSNGLIINKKPTIIKDILDNGIKQISFSYHYGVQDKWSKVSLKEVENAVKLSVNGNLQVCLLCSLCTKNYLKVAEICKKAFDLHASEVHFTNFILQGRAKVNNFSKYVLNDEQIKIALQEIDEERKKYDKKRLYISRCGSFGNDICSKNFMCDAGTNDVVITPDNNIYGCLFFAGIPEYKIGQYKNGKIVIDKSSKFDCNNCYAKNILNYNNMEALKLTKN